MTQQVTKVETYCGWTEAEIDEAVEGGFFVPDCVIKYFVLGDSDQKRQMDLKLTSEAV